MSWSLAWAPSHRVAARKSGQIAGDGLVNLGCDDTCLTLLGSEEVEHIAISRNTSI